MLKSLSEEHHRTIVKNLEYIDDKLVDTGANKFRRRFKEQSKEKFIDYQRLRAQNEFEILRNEPKICRLIREIYEKKIDTKLYPYVEAPKEMKKDK